MSDSSDRIQLLRTRISEVKDALSAFQRKSAFTPQKLGMASMIRYADEQSFSLLYQKVDGLLEQLNKLEADIENDMDDIHELWTEGDEGDD